ncbi:MAG: GYD domain-containing protein [Streptosporangiaceae bacterium]
MPKYLTIASYTAEGVKGLIAKGGTARVEAARRVLADAGGTLEGFYFALGSDDSYIVCDLPDNAAAAATAMAAAASGMVVNRMVPLLTADEVDRAATLRPRYDAPGS